MHDNFVRVIFTVSIFEFNCCDTKSDGCFAFTRNACNLKPLSSKLSLLSLVILFFPLIFNANSGKVGYENEEKKGTLIRKLQRWFICWALKWPVRDPKQ